MSTYNKIYLEDLYNENFRKYNNVIDNNYNKNINNLIIDFTKLLSFKDNVKFIRLNLENKNKNIIIIILDERINFNLALRKKK